MGRVNAPANIGPALSDCASDYARCLANPFTGPIACVPTFPALMTQRMKCYAKGVLSTGTNSFGYIVVDPAQLVANNFSAIVTSTAATAVAVVATNAVQDPNAAFFATNSEYASTAFGSTPATAKYRIVGAGVRIRYIGTQLNLGGYLIGLHEPDHNNLNNQTIANLDAQLESRRLVPDREWATVLYKPIETLDLEFQDSFPGNASASADGAYYMGFAITSAVAGQPFEWEYYGVYEMEGRNLRRKTPSHKDPVGFSAVHTIASTSQELYPTKRKDQEREHGFLSRALDYLGSGISHASKWIEGVGTAGRVASAMRGALPAARAGGFMAGLGNFAARAALPAAEALMLAL